MPKHVLHARLNWQAAPQMDLWVFDYVDISRGMASGGTVEEGRRLWLSAIVDF